MLETIETELVTAGATDKWRRLRRRAELLRRLLNPNLSSQR
jgi:hypothetical protein